MLSPRRLAPQDEAAPVGDAHERVVFHTPRGSRGDHDTATKAQLAQGLAALLGLDYAGVHVEGDPPPPARTYFVPEETLHAKDAARLGIRGTGDLFGGVVPASFVATKVITHPLVRLDATAPEGWSAAFAERVRDVVLPGYAVFSAVDARRACARLLESGAARFKAAAGVGGSGQAVISRGADLERVLAAIDPADLRRNGAVLECNLEAVRTYSVGQVRLGAVLLSYHGRQRLTRKLLLETGPHMRQQIAIARAVLQQGDKAFDAQGFAIENGAFQQAIRAGDKAVARLPMHTIESQ